MELHTGINLAINELKQNLLALGYKRNNSLNGAGQYKKDKKSVEFVKRKFVYWDGIDKSMTVRVNFSGVQVNTLHDISTNEELSLFRLEPQLIGKIYPEHNEDRVLIPFENVPQSLIDALIAVEDEPSL